MFNNICPDMDYLKTTTLEHVPLMPKSHIGRSFADPTRLIFPR